MKLKITLILAALSAGIHLYLTNHFHQVQMGTNVEKSSCNINSTFNCDTVAASEYASVANIPISSFGFSTNLILLVLLLIVILKLTETPNKFLRAGFYLSLLSSGASLVMGAISLTQLTTYCLYCIALYVLSFLITAMLYMACKKETVSLSFGDLTKDISSYLKAPVWPIVFALSIPALAFFTHKTIQANHQDGDSKDFERLVKTSINDWKNSELIDLEGVKPSLIKGVKNQTPKIVVAEFADFRCGHCKRASGPLATFVNSHPDVQLKFYNFPLDGECNDEIKQKNGVSCRLAKSVHCAAEQSLGSLFHDKIFEHQKDFYSVASSDGVDNKLKALISVASINWDSLKSCMDSTATHEAIKAQAAIGKKVGVQGTPKIYLNNKPLPGGFFLPILKKARELALKEVK